MKYSISIITLFLLVSISIYSQSWQPINPLNSYNYKTDSIDYITNVLRVDSIENINSNPVYFLNRIMTSCDTCSSNIYALRNQPQFLMRQVTKVSDSLFLFQDTLEYVFMPLSGFGDSWVFDSQNNIHAVVSYVGEGIVLGVQDSIKHVSLSNGTEILLSKNYGIYKFPNGLTDNYNLVGIRGSINIGDDIKYFDDFFDIEGGDIFQKMVYMGSWGDGSIETYKFKKYIIDFKYHLHDTIKLGVSGWVKKVTHYELNSYTYDTISYPFVDTLIFVDSIDHFTNAYPNQIINLNNHINEFPNYFYDNYEMLNRVSYYKEDGRLVKAVYGNWDPQYYVDDSTHNDLLIIDPYYSFAYLSLKYEEDLGLSLETGFFEGGYKYISMGRVRDGDTIGTVFFDSHFEQYYGIENNEDLFVSVYPNPTQGLLSISGLTGNEKLSLIDIFGRQLECEQNQSNINLGNHPSGIYFLRIERGQENRTFKVVKL